MKRISVLLLVLMAFLALPQVGFCFRPPPPPHPGPPIGIPPGARYHHHGGGDAAAAIFGTILGGVILSEVVKANQPPPPVPLPAQPVVINTTLPVNCKGKIMSRDWLINGKLVKEYACFEEQ
ncbi:MAG: hypothetical protein WAV16_03230 [Candidatus Moraniibacteriota bacterium]